MFPYLHIDTSVPKGWNEKYTTVEVISADQARNVIERFFDLKGTFVLGLDMRGASSFVMTLLLKFIETSTLKLIIRATEPVPSTIISRCAKVSKTSIIDKQTFSKLIYGTGIVVDKILQLR